MSLLRRQSSGELNLPQTWSTSCIPKSVLHAACHLALTTRVPLSLVFCRHVCPPEQGGSPKSIPRRGRFPPSSSAHGIFQARVLEWGAIAFSKSLTTVSQSMGETPELRKAANRPGRASGNNIISCEKAGLFLSSFLSLDSFKEIVFVQC